MWNPEGKLKNQIVSNSNVVMECGVADINLSDHQLVYIQRKKQKMPTKRITFQGRSYKNFNTNDFKNDIVELDWDGFFASRDPETLWDIMFSNIMVTTDRMCPMKQFKVKKYRDPWISSELIELIKEKDRALKKAKKDKKR